MPIISSSDWNEAETGGRGSFKQARKRPQSAQEGRSSRTPSHPTRKGFSRPVRPVTPQELEYFGKALVKLPAYFQEIKGKSKEEVAEIRRKFEEGLQNEING